jgi:hypothetical protein
MSQYSNSFYDELLPLYYISRFCNSVVLYDARQAFVTLCSCSVFLKNGGFMMFYAIVLCTGVWQYYELMLEDFTGKITSFSLLKALI